MANDSEAQSSALTDGSVDEANEGRVRAIDRSIDLLTLLSDGPLSATELAARIGTTRGVTQRLLGSLHRRTLVVKDEATSEYLLGPGCLQLNDGWHRFAEVAALVRPTMEDLRSDTGETTIFSVCVGAERVVLLQVESDALIRYSGEIRGGRPLHLGAAGRVLLAFQDPAHRDRLLHALRTNGPDALRPEDQNSLIRELDEIRAKGYGKGSRVSGAVGIAAPILQGERVIAALSVVGPAERFTPDREAMLVGQLLTATRKLGKIPLPVQSQALASLS